MIILFSRQDLITILVLPAMWYSFQYAHARICSMIRRRSWEYQCVTSISSSLKTQWRQISSFPFCSLAASTVRSDVCSMPLSRCICQRPQQRSFFYAVLCGALPTWRCAVRHAVVLKIFHTALYGASQVVRCAVRRVAPRTLYCPVLGHKKCWL